MDPAPSAEKVAQDFQVPLFKSISDALSSSYHFDAAVVCTPNDNHVSISINLLDAGKHVLVEKPISSSVHDGRRLVAHARTLNLTLLVGHHRRFNPYIVTTKALLDSHALGAILAVSALWTLYKTPSYFSAPTAWHASSTTGGCISINLVHDIDLLQHLLGPITRVHAEATTRQRNHPVDEGCAILLRFASGTVGTFILSDAAPSPHSFEAGTGENPMIPQTGKDFYRFFGTEGTLSVPDMTVTRYGKGVEKSWTEVLEMGKVEVQEDVVPFDKQIEHFVNVVRGGEEVMCSGEEAVRAVEVCEAVKRAMETGMVVQVGGA